MCQHKWFVSHTSRLKQASDADARYADVAAGDNRWPRFFHMTSLLLKMKEIQYDDMSSVVSIKSLTVKKSVWFEQEEQC